MRHVIADVVFHQLSHKAIDSAASGGEALEDVGAGFIGVEGAQNAFELADNFFGAIDEIEFFARSVAHIGSTTLWGYGIKGWAWKQEAC